MGVVQSTLIEVVNEIDPTAVRTLAACLEGADVDERHAGINALLARTHLGEQDNSKLHRDVLFSIGEVLERNDSAIRAVGVLTLAAIMAYGHYGDRRCSAAGYLAWETDVQVLQARMLLLQRVALC